jgi:hypothetical protein
MRPFRSSIMFCLISLALSGCGDNPPAEPLPPELILLTNQEISLSYEGLMPIQVRYEEDGRSVGGQEIVFEIVTSSVVGNLGSTTLSDESVISDSATATRGEATTWVEAGTSESGFLVHVRVASDPSIDPVAVQVQVMENVVSMPHLLLLTEAEPLVTFDQRVVVQVRYIDPDNVPIPDTFISFEPMSDTADTHLSSLNSKTNAEGIAETTIQAGTQEVDFQIKISVFDDDSVEPLIVRVSVTLHELWPDIEGDYDITSSMNILDAIPDNLDQMLQFFDGFFAEPGLWILELIAAGSADSYWDQGVYDIFFDLCSAVGQSSEGANPRCLAAGQVAASDFGISAAAIVEGLLNAGLTQLGIDQSIGYMLEPGSAFFDNAQSPTMAGTLTIASQPDESGNLGQTNYLRYNLVSWIFEDATHMINLSAEEIISADDISAAIVFDPQLETYALDVSPYGMEVAYGQLLISAINKIILPALIDPSLDSFEDLFVYLIDCEDLAAQLNENYAIPEAVTQSICEGLEVTASVDIGSWLSGRVSSSSNYFYLSTPVDEPCPLGLSPTGEFLIQSMGEPEAGSQCVWQGEVRELEQDPNGAEVSGDWWADLL